MDPRRLHVLHRCWDLVPLTLGPVPLQLDLDAELSEGNAGCHSRSVPVMEPVGVSVVVVVRVVPGHDGSNCGLTE